MPGILEAITAGFTAASDISKAVTEGLPSDEQQFEAFKRRSPLIYQRIYNRILRRDYRRLKMPKNKRVPVTSYVQWQHSDLPKSLQEKLIEVLQFQLGRV